MVLKPFQRVIKWTFQNVIYMLGSYSSKHVGSIFSFKIPFTNFTALEVLLLTSLKQAMLVNSLKVLLISQMFCQRIQ